MEHSRTLLAGALIALTAAGIATLVLLFGRPSGGEPEDVSIRAGNGSRTAVPESSSIAAPAARPAPTDRRPIEDPVARLKKLYGIDPNRSDLNGKFIGEYACDDTHPPAQIAATEGIDAVGLSSLNYVAWKVAFRFAPNHVGHKVLIRWKGWNSKDLAAVELLEICRNHDDANVRDLGSYDPGVSDDEIVRAGAPGEIEVKVGDATYRYRLQRK